MMSFSAQCFLITSHVSRADHVHTRVLSYVPSQDHVRGQCRVHSGRGMLQLSWHRALQMALARELPRAWLQLQDTELGRALQPGMWKILNHHTEN